MVEETTGSDLSYNDEYIIVESPKLQQNESIIDLDNLPKVSFAFQH